MAIPIFGISPGLGFGASRAAAAGELAESDAMHCLHYSALRWEPTLVRTGHPPRRVLLVATVRGLIPVELPLYRLTDVAGVLYLRQHRLMVPVQDRSDLVPLAASANPCLVPLPKLSERSIIVVLAVLALQVWIWSMSVGDACRV